MIIIQSMLNKKIYTKAVGISEEDLDYIKVVRGKKIFSATSLAGTNSAIIKYFKKNNDK